MNHCIQHHSFDLFFFFFFVSTPECRDTVLGACMYRSQSETPGSPQSRRELEVLEEMQARKHEETAREPKQQRQARQVLCRSEKWKPCHVSRLQIRYDHYDIITFRVSYKIFRKGGWGGGKDFRKGEVPHLPPPPPPPLYESLHFALNSSRNLQYSNIIVHLHTMYVT